jgi:hypothetical protein
MEGSVCKRITVGVGDTVRLPITLGPNQRILKCISKNPAIATCSHRATTASVTGRSPGRTLVIVIVSLFNRPFCQLLFAVEVVEDNEE